MPSTSEGVSPFVNGSEGGLLFTLFKLPQAAFIDPATKFLYRWAGASWIMLAIERTYNPGLNRYHHPVFVGSRRDVSAMLQHSLPLGRDGQFRSDLNLAGGSGRLVADLEGVVIAEAKIDTPLHHREFQRVMTVLKSGSFKGRKPRHRKVSDMPMRAVIVPTADSAHPLPDDSSGNWMYVAVELLQPKVDIEAWMKQNRDQLWAEALHYFRNGINSKFPIDGNNELGAAIRRAQGAINERLRFGSSH